MKLRLAFQDWQRNGKSVYNTSEGIELSMGMFHSGTIFEATIKLDEDEAVDLLEYLAEGYEPVFSVFEVIE